MSEYALVVIGYNRVSSIARLLKFLKQAEYCGDDVTLIISIDNSGNDEVEMYAKNFTWPYGEKKVRTFPERQGLRKHILQCGDLVKDYRAIAVFEDDIVPAPGFYAYMKSAVDFYESNDNIAGISLYTHLWNVNVNLPFQPSYSGYDTYFMQFAQSWGQVWMKKQWSDFAEWYQANNEPIKPQDNIPPFVTSWPETSWLKYHIKYCIEKNKYFVYPYQSLTTCFSDVGEHCLEKDTHIQVPMLYAVRDDFKFASFGNDSVRYDAFFERVWNKEAVIDDFFVKDICVSLYGNKPIPCDSQERYYLTTSILPYEIRKSYGLELRPFEENAVFGIAGKDIFLYDLSSKIENADVDKKTKKKAELGRYKYMMRLRENTRLTLSYTKSMIKDKIKRKILK